MSRAKIILLILSFFLLIGVLIITFYEVKEVPDYNWFSHYNYESNEPNDLYLFKSLIEEKYGLENLNLNEADSVYLEKGEDNLYVTIGDQIRFNSYEKDKFIEYISAGNNALIIARRIDVLNEKYDSLIDLSGDNMVTPYDVIADTTFCFDMNFISEDTTVLCYKKYIYNIEKPRKVTHTTFVEDSLGYIEELAYNHNYYRSFFGRIQIDSGYIYIHTIPNLFTNYGSLQDYYLPHFNKVFSYLPAEKVVLDKPKNRFYYDPANRKSPIDFILQTDSLRWSYYLTIGGMILFAFFRGKRKQRVVPMVKKNINTSMEYIQTLSELYKNQNQNHKLVKHIKANFLHNIKKKYNIDPNVEDYSRALSKKTKIELSDIENLMHKFNSAESSDFTDEQLIVLHKQIESFYKKAK